MAITIESSIKQLDAATEAAKKMATRLGDVNSAIADVSQTFQKSDNSLQGFVDKVSSVNELSKAFSGVYAAVVEQNSALKSDALEWVFEKTNQVATGVKSMKSAYDEAVSVYTQLQPLYDTSVKVLNKTKEIVGDLAKNVNKHSIALQINKVKTFLCAGAQAVATATTKAWNKVTNQAINNLQIRLPVGLVITSVAVGIYTAILVPATVATYAFSESIKAVSKAIYSIPVVGWILAIVGVIITLVGLIIKAFKWLWDNSMEFREVLFGVWEVIKMVFGGLWDFIVNIATGLADFFVSIWNGLTGFLASAWEGITGFFTGLWDNITGFFSGLWESITGIFTSLWESITGFFSGIWEGISGFFSGAGGSIMAFISSVWQSISAIFINIWNKLVSTFTTIKDWISTNLIQPLKNAFSGLWNFICNMVNNVINRLSGMLAPIKELWNTLFGKTKAAWETGKAKGRESFLKDQKEKELAATGQTGKGDTGKGDANKGERGSGKGSKGKNDTDIIPGLGGLGGTPSIQNMGNGGGAVNDKIGSVGSDSGKASNTYITLGSLVENLTIQSASIAEGMDDMRDMVVRTLLEVLNGQNVAGAKY